MKNLRRYLAVLLCVMMCFSLAVIAPAHDIDTETQAVTEELETQSDAPDQSAAEATDTVIEGDVTETETVPPAEETDDAAEVTEPETADTTGTDGAEIVENDAAAEGEDQPAPVAEISAEPVQTMSVDEPVAIASGEKVTLKALDVTAGQTMISNDLRIIKEGVVQYQDGQTYSLGEGGKLTSDQLNTSPYKMEGWTFVGWYTAPVKYYYWGDYTYSKWEATEIPEDFRTNCDGENINFTVDKQQYPEADQTYNLKSYWLWLSTLDGEGKKVTADTELSGGETLYACYEPTAINYDLDFHGWGGSRGTLHCGRQYGTPFGKNDMKEWNGFVFDGWYPVDGGKALDFYSIPENGKKYVAHWHSEDGRVDQSNYQRFGYKEVTKVTMIDTSNGGNKELADTVSLHGGGLSTIYVEVSPDDIVKNNGVTELTWTTTDAAVADVEVLDGGMRANIKRGNKPGTATITVKSENGRFDSVVVNTDTHVWGDSKVIQWGDCAKPTKVRYTCAYCGATYVSETYTKHNFAYRDIPATCTTKHIWQHYCKVCGYVDGDDWVQGPAKGHSFRTTTSSGCSGTVTTNTCTVCGYTETSNDNVAVHNWSSEATIDVRPTCYTNGSKSIKCLNCGISKEGTSEVIRPDPSLHEWSAWVVTDEATETEEGMKVRTCSVCHTEETRSIPPTGLEIDTSNIAKGIKLSSPKEVANQAQANAIIQRIIDQMLSSGDESMLADDILYASLTGKEITTEIIMTPVAAPENAADAQKFIAMISEDGSVVYMDIDIIVKADGENIGRITETGSAMTFQVALPKGGRIIRVLRAHEGQVEEIPCWVEGDTVYFTTDKFSTFGVSSSNDIADATIDAIADQTYTGAEIKPGVKVTINGSEVLEEGKDYSVSYKDNVNIGTATAVITGMGDFEGSSAEVTFNIVKAAEGSSGFRSPRTGDENRIGFWTCILAASCVCLIFGVTRRRKVRG